MDQQGLLNSTDGEAWQEQPDWMNEAKPEDTRVRLWASLNSDSLGNKATLLRLANMGFSCLLGTASLLTLVTAQSLTTMVIASYLWVFSALICCFEAHVKRVAKVIAAKCGFIFYPIPRAIFLFFVAVLSFSLGLFGIIAGCAFIVSGILTIYFAHRYPEYMTLQYRHAEEDLGGGLQSYVNAHPEQAARVLAGITAASLAQRDPQPTPATKDEPAWVRDAPAAAV